MSENVYTSIDELVKENGQNPGPLSTGQERKGAAEGEAASLGN